MPDSLALLTDEICACRRCPRLTDYRERVAAEKRRAFTSWDYWGRPVPGFGDPAARLLIVGLAPAAHGGNRTGRVFTGDSSGDFLFAALHRAGYANQPTSTSRDDGLTLTDCYILAAARCAPPDNLPTREEFASCRPFAQRELALLPNVRVMLALGAIAWDVALGLIEFRGKTKFAHVAHVSHAAMHVVASYHPSHRNTATKLLTSAMMDDAINLASTLSGANF